MSEIEIKILGIDADAVCAKLEELGADRIFEGRLNCVHFDQPGRPIKKAKSLFRLRRWKGVEPGMDKFEICYKGPKRIIDGCKVREEIETTVADGDTFEAMMSSLGYEITMNNDKRRRSYELGGAHFDIDEYPTVPAYMEIEGSDRGVIDRAIETVGLGEFEESTETANELFKRLWPEVNFRQLRF